jgi:hypothetical protein
MVFSGLPSRLPYGLALHRRRGVVKAGELVTSVRVFNTNARKVLSIPTPVKDGKSIVSGDYHIDGMSGTAAKSGVDMPPLRRQDRFIPWPVAAVRTSGLVRRSCPVPH